MPLAPSSADERDNQFVSTRWTMVLAAGNSQIPSQAAANALSELCRIYWRPLYLFLRRQGAAPVDAQALTQGFFADLIATRSYARANQEKGRFRSFLLGALKHFVAMRVSTTERRNLAGANSSNHSKRAGCGKWRRRSHPPSAGIRRRFMSANGQRRFSGKRSIASPRSAQ